MAAIDDLVSNLKGGVQNLGAVAQALQNVFPRITGTVTLANATVTVVAQNNVAANSLVFLTATNATAALTERTAGVFVTALIPGTSFSVSTQSGMAAGGETFQYFLVNPS